MTERDVRQALADAILACFQALAKIDGASLQSTVDEWAARYVARRIPEEGP